MYDTEKAKEAFFALRAESANWTGYDSVVVENAAKTGIALCDAANERYMEFKKLRIQFTGAILIAVIAFAAISFGIKAGVSGSQYDKGYSAGVKASITDSDYVEFRNDRFGTVYIKRENLAQQAR